MKTAVTLTENVLACCLPNPVMQLQIITEKLARNKVENVQQNWIFKKPVNRHASLDLQRYESLSESWTMKTSISKGCLPDKHASWHNNEYNNSLKPVCPPSLLKPHKARQKCRNGVTFCQHLKLSGSVTHCTTKLIRKYTNPAYRHSYFCKQKLTAPPSVPIHYYRFTGQDWILDILCNIYVHCAMSKVKVDPNLYSVHYTLNMSEIWNLNTNNENTKLYKLVWNLKS